MLLDLRDPIFKGCTRPATVWGVPLVPMIIIVGAMLILGALAGAVFKGPSFLIALGSLMPIFLVLREVSRRDDHRLVQILIRFRLARFGQIATMRSVRTYGPLRFVGR